MQIFRDQPMLVSYRVPVANSLLAALPVKDCQTLLEHMETITLTAGEVLYRPCEPIRHVYFSTDTMVSLLTSAEGQQALEVGMVGREGILGVPLALGVNESPVQAVVQGAGMALRMTSAHFRWEFQHSPRLQQGV
jgi:CRP-like cAMP-binding protein